MHIYVQFLRKDCKQLFSFQLHYYAQALQEECHDWLHQMLFADQPNLKFLY